MFWELDRNRMCTRIRTVAKKRKTKHRSQLTAANKSLKKITKSFFIIQFSTIVRCKLCELNIIPPYSAQNIKDYIFGIIFWDMSFYFWYMQETKMIKCVEEICRTLLGLEDYLKLKNSKIYFRHTFIFWFLADLM